MNLLDRRKAGLIVLSALFLFACESDITLGLPFDPEIENINAHYTELALPFKLAQIDSVNTTNRNRILVGNYLNAHFGKVKATAFTDFSISNKGTISSDDVFDSLSLMIVNDYYLGETRPALPQTFSVYQLTDTLARKNHYSFESVAYSTNAIGSLTFTPAPEVASSPDTLHIHMNDVIGRDLFEKAKSSAKELSTDSTFQDYFKGVALVPESENNYMTGFDPAGLRLVLYYSAPEDTVSSTYTFALEPTTTTITFNNIQHDRSGTAIAGIGQAGNTGQSIDGRFYLQSGTGLSPIIDFQPLLDFVSNIKDSANGQNILFNRVDLRIAFPAASVEKAPTVVRAYNIDENLNRQVAGVSSNRQAIYLGLSDQQNNYEASAIQLDTLGSYDLKITSYMQNLVDGDLQSLVDRGLKKTEYLLQADDISYTVNQIVTEADSVKLRIYYTTLE